CAQLLQVAQFLGPTLQTPQETRWLTSEATSPRGSQATGIAQPFWWKSSKGFSDKRSRSSSKSQNRKRYSPSKGSVWYFTLARAGTQGIQPRRTPSPRFH